jgi:hypothetical protein
VHPAKLFAGQKLKKALMFALFEHVIAGSKDFLLIATTAPLFTEAANIIGWITSAGREGRLLPLFSPAFEHFFR